MQSSPLKDISLAVPSAHFSSCSRSLITCGHECRKRRGTGTCAKPHGSRSWLYNSSKTDRRHDLHFVFLLISSRPRAGRLEDGTSKRKKISFSWSRWEEYFKSSHECPSHRPQVRTARGGSATFNPLLPACSRHHILEYSLLFCRMRMSLFQRVP